MEGTLRGRIIRGIGANAFGQGVNAAVQIIGVPLFLYFWGKELYGEWLIVFAAPAYLLMSDVGFSKVAGNEMTMLVARSRQHEALEVFQSVWVLVSGIAMMLAVLIFALLAILMPGGHLESWFNLTLMSSSEASLILATLSVYVLLVLQGDLFDAGFRCEGNYALGAFLSNLVRAFEWGLVFLAIGLGAMPFVTAFALLAGRAVGVFAQRAALRRKSPWIVYGFKVATPLAVKRLALPAVAYVGFPLGNAVFIQGMVLMVGVVLGPVAVVVFSTYRTLSRMTVQLSAAIYNSVWPELSSAYSAGNLALARNLYHRMANATLWTTLVIVSLLAILGDWIISLWTDNQVAYDSSLLYLMLGVAVADALWQMSRIVLVSANRHVRSAAAYLTAAVGAILLSYILMPSVGIEGAALSLLVANLAIVPYATKGALTLLEDKLFPYVMALALPPWVLRGSKK